MRGVSPVIATVLLLLIAVAAVGGAWVWYQKMQSTAEEGGQAGVAKIRAGTGIQYLFIDRAHTKTANVNLTLVIGNQGPEAVKITGIKVDTGSGYADCNDTFIGNGASYIVPSEGFFTALCKNVTKPSSGDSIKVKVYSGAITRVMQAVVE